MRVPRWEAFSGVLALGCDVSEVGAVAMALRTIIIYIFSLALVRLGSKRLLSDATAFDFIVAIMLDSMPDPVKVQLSYLERSGKISVVPGRDEPRVVVVPVEDGVQTIRVEIG